MRTLGDRILVKAEKQKEKSAGGLYVAPAADEKTVRGKVVSVGAGRLTVHGERIPVSISVGETVVFGKFAGQEVTDEAGDQTFLVVREDDILAVLP